jgi:hypothetical protein
MRIRRLETTLSSHYLVFLILKMYSKYRSRTQIELCSLRFPLHMIQIQR